jgi:tetratricopeptide (TPR) repeat protein
MKLMISYSRQDSIEVYRIEKELQGRHSVWIDKAIIGGQQWWESILTAIDAAECILVMLSRDAVESIFCQEELKYAVALNKPIIPVMLRLCTFPESLNNRQTQYIEAPKLNNDHDRIMREIVESLAEMRDSIRNGSYPLSDPLPKRPPVPGKHSPLDVPGLYADGVDALAHDRLDEAEAMFNRVIQMGHASFVDKAKKKLQEVEQTRLRNSLYESIVKLAQKPRTLADAQELWNDLTAQFGTDYDPQDIAVNFTPTKNGLTSEQHLAEARAKFNEEDYDSTITSCTIAIELKSHAAEAYSLRSRARSRKSENPDIAFQDADTAIRLNPKWAEGYFSRGSARKNKGDIDGAIADYNEAIRLDPDRGRGVRWREIPPKQVRKMAGNRREMAGKSNLPPKLSTKNGGKVENSAAAETMQSFSPP